MNEADWRLLRELLGLQVSFEELRDNFRNPEWRLKHLYGFSPATINKVLERDLFDEEK